MGTLWFFWLASAATAIAGHRAAFRMRTSTAPAAKLRKVLYVVLGVVAAALVLTQLLTADDILMAITGVFAGGALAFFIGSGLLWLVAPEGSSREKAPEMAVIVSGISVFLALATLIRIPQQS